MCDSFRTICINPIFIRDIFFGSSVMLHLFYSMRNSLHFFQLTDHEEKMITLKSMKSSKPDQKSPQIKIENFEHVITSAIGEFGKSQLIIVLATKLPMIFASWSMIMMSFAGKEPNWWLETSTRSLNGIAC